MATTTSQYGMKFICIWLKHCKATHIVWQHLQKLPNITCKNNLATHKIIIPFAAWCKIENQIDNVAKYANIQVLYANYTKPPKSINSAIMLAREQQLISLGDRVACSNIDDYNMAKRQLYFTHVMIHYKETDNA